jgi:hypothetical protein
VEEIGADLGTRRAALPKLAADGAAFREAVAYISAEEDRERALAANLIPDALAEIDLAEHALDCALGVRARAAAKATLETQVFPAQQRVIKTFRQLEKDLAELERVSSETRGTVTDPRAGDSASIFDPLWLVWGMPPALRARLHRWADKFAMVSIGYKPDLAAWHRERHPGLFGSDK